MAALAVDDRHRLFTVDLGKVCDVMAIRGDREANKEGKAPTPTRSVLRGVAPFLPLSLPLLDLKI